MGIEDGFGGRSSKFLCLCYLEGQIGKFSIVTNKIQCDKLHINRLTLSQYIILKSIG